MIVYILMLVFTFLLGLGIMKNNENQQKKYICIILAFLILFSVMGFRYGVGQDYFYTYKPVFEYILQNGEYSNIEFGYVILNKIVQLFTNDYAGIFLVTSFLFVYFIYKAILEQSSNIALSIFILIAGCFYFYAMNVVRQSIAIAIFIYSLKYIENKKFWKYMICIIFASMLHNIALIFIPVYFIANKKMNFKFFAILAIGVVITMPVFIKIINIIFEGTKYGNYITGYYATSENSMISPLINLILLVVCFLLSKKQDNDQRLNMYKNIHAIGVFTSIYIGAIPLASRIFVNFYHIGILSIPYLISKFKNKKTREILYILCICVFIFYFTYSVGIKNGNKVLPYNTIFYR